MRSIVLFIGGIVLSGCGHSPPSEVIRLDGQPASSQQAEVVRSNCAGQADEFCAVAQGYIFVSKEKASQAMTTLRNISDQNAREREAANAAAIVQKKKQSANTRKTKN